MAKCGFWQQPWKTSWKTLGSSLFSVLGGCMVSLATAEAGFAAETIRIQQGLFSVSISVAALEQFAATGQVPPELQNTLGRLNQETLANVHQQLNFSLDMNVVAMSQLANSKLGQDYFTRMGTLVRTGTGQNGFLALRAAHIAAAQEPEGLTPIGVIRYFPTDILINFRDLRDLNRQFTSFVQYKFAALEAVQQQADQERASGPGMDFTQQPDLRQPGPFSVTVQTLTLQDEARTGLLNADSRTFDVDLYLPQTEAAVPVVVISHGWGAAKESFAFLGEHLASYGFAVVAPQHVGSDTQFQRGFLTGLLDEDIPPQEYIDRPLDVTYTLDELGRLSAPGQPYQGRFDLERVGMIGHSLGGYTSLAIAGAPINYTRLQQNCVPERPFRFNLSVYLQCRAAPLPTSDIRLRDERVDAAIALNPITSVVQGPSQLEQIDIPVMLAAANVDLLAPPIQEQIHPFTWLTSQDKYLVTMVPAGHGTSVQASLADHERYGGLAPNTILGSAYTRALSTAFMQVYVAGDASYQPFLRAAYASYLSADPITLEMVQSLTPEQLEAAYGQPPPLPVSPAEDEL